MTARDWPADHDGAQPRFGFVPEPLVDAPHRLIPFSFCGDEPRIAAFPGRLDLRSDGAIALRGDHRGSQRQRCATRRGQAGAGFETRNGNTSRVGQLRRENEIGVSDVLEQVCGGVCRGSIVARLCQARRSRAKLRSFQPRDRGPVPALGEQARVAT